MLEKQLTNSFKTFSGGLPTTATELFVTMGLSINLGFSDMI